MGDDSASAFPFDEWRELGTAIVNAREAARALREGSYYNEIPGADFLRQCGPAVADAASAFWTAWIPVADEVTRGMDSSISRSQVASEIMYCTRKAQEAPGVRSVSGWTLWDDGEEWADATWKAYSDVKLEWFDPSLAPPPPTKTRKKRKKFRFG